MNYPTVVAMQFADGVRDVPEHVATLLKQHKIPTASLTFEKAIERMDWANANQQIDSAFSRIQNDHLRQFGR